MALTCSGLLALFFGVLGVTSFTEQNCLRDWAEVPATVEESTTIKQPSGKYKFSVRYRYEFANQEFHSNCYDLFPFVSSKSADAASLVNQYPVGSTITVHVNPASPSHAFVNAKAPAWWSIVPVLLGLFFIYQGAHMMWRSVTAHCILRRGASGGTRSGITFYFFDSLEAAQKATQWKSVSTQGFSSARTVAFLTALLFACTGLAGLVFLITQHDLPEILMLWGYVVLPLCAILGLGGMWSCLTAKYVLDQKDGLGQEVISLYSSKDELQKAESLQNQLPSDDKETQK
jgi:hypothetical protein